jgi:LPXTG-motif cell wall-anchored protein
MSADAGTARARVRVLAALTALTALAAVTAVTAGAAPAAADDEIGLSRDGRTWSHTIRGPLLDEDFRWVPGDEVTESFFVRNQGPTAGHLAVDVRTVDGHRLLAPDAVRLAWRVGDGPWHEVADGTIGDGAARQAFALGEAVRVDLSVRFAAAAPNDTMGRQLPLEVVVRLSGDGGDPDGPDEPDEPDGQDDQGDQGDQGDQDDQDDQDGQDESPDPGALPDTGAAVPAWVLWLAAVLVGGGAALVRRRRRGRHG